jgi:hypothetical protein
LASLHYAGRKSAGDAAWGQVVEWGEPYTGRDITLGASNHALIAAHLQGERPYFVTILRYVGDHLTGAGANVQTTAALSRGTGRLDLVP